MRRLACLSLALLLALATPAAAVGPVVGPARCEASWTVPAGATDLAEYRLSLGTAAGGPYTLYKTVVAVPAPAPGTVVLVPCTDITGEGQRYAVVTAVDLAGNESPRSNEFPFAFDRAAPVAPTNLRVK